jgi:hypothetical protein
MFNGDVNVASDEFERNWKEETIIYFTLLCYNSVAKCGENQCLSDDL